MESKIAKLFRELDLGEIETPILPVSGGLMHRMYKVVSEGHAYAVKALNPEILARPEARANYEKAEHHGLESYFRGTMLHSRKRPRENACDRSEGYERR